jgi:hypothetical protein
MTRHVHAMMKFLAAGAAVSGLVLGTGAGPAAGAAPQHAGVRAAPGAAGTWGNAIEVPGLAALNVRGASVLSVSCGSVGNCSAAGTYTDSSSHIQGYVVSQSNGAWGTAIEVPGLAALNADGFAGFPSVSCGSAGNCSAGGSYMDGFGKFQGFVVSQSNGVWGTAVEVPGLAALNTGGNAEITSVSCASAGNCSAVGTYQDPSNAFHNQGFVVSQTSGRWGTAIEVPGLAALNTGGTVTLNNVSCASAGNCSAGGTYLELSNPVQGFVVSQSRGRWGKAIEVPGLGALNTGRQVSFDSVSCGAVGNCAADGSYVDSSGAHQGFVVSQTSGVWGTAIEVPGLGALNADRDAEGISVSCASAGNCSAGGSYTDGSDARQGFVVSQSNGVWGTAIEVPGLGALNTAGSAGIGSMSCASAGRCSAGGFYGESLKNEGFVVTES